MKTTVTSAAPVSHVKQYFSWNVLSKIIKTGIIKSNLIGTLAGLCLALYINGFSFMEGLPFAALSLIGTALVIGGSCSINNFYDQDIDIIMERTKERPTVNGDINPKFALWFGVFQVLAGVIVLANASLLAALMGFLGFVFYVFFYTMYTKRRTVYNTEVGSISGAMPPLIGWCAVSSDLFHPFAIGLFLLMFLWQPPHFYGLAVRRVEEYRSAGVPMLPVTKGMLRTKIQTLVYLVLLLPVPLFFQTLGNLFVWTMTLLTVGWIVIGLLGFNKMEDQKWAKVMFVYSLNYIMIVLGLMAVLTVF
ncbi:heme o synthase [Bacillus taeanensis]|uniref:Protoheme IX farnesyltransferase n=1 Tax=Bacillus taeanensis TaxID=273032 RepID=A0A366XVW7_9BACI|nr:heme o synthase [Bacillus taeanensis]RBW69718.1 protoheme IX farnesyltransferase [Bacillus taeanensis]